MYTHSKKHCTLNNTTDWDRRLLEYPQNIVPVGHVSLGSINMAAKRVAVFHNHLGPLVVTSTPRQGNDMFCTVLGHVYGQTATKSTEASDNKIRQIISESQNAGCRSHRHVDFRLFSVGNHNLADVSSATHIRERRGDILEGESLDGMDGLDVASFVQQEDSGHQTGIGLARVLE